MPARCYLDWNATAPLRPEARDAMARAMDAVGNPSSVHAEGRAARGLVEAARRQVAALVECAPEEVVFTSGATEAANMVGALGWSRVLATPIEHDAVRAQADAVLDLVTPDGQIDIARLDPGAGVIDGPETGRVLFCLAAANGEIGVIQPVDAAIAALMPGSDTRLHTLCDATQAIGKTAFSLRGRAIDYAILSAHKFGGPKGVGAVLAAPGKLFAPLLKGGGQERSFRSGTENVVAIAGLGAAAEAAARDLADGRWERVAELRDRMEARLADAAPDLQILGRGAPRLPNTSSFATPGWRGETQVIQMDLAGFAVSSGSACSSGKVKESAVLRAMGRDAEAAGSALRVSLGPNADPGEIDAFCAAWIAAYRRHSVRSR